jgi:hypothetical protein
MDKETLKYFIEYKHNKKAVIIDDYCVGNAGWEVQIVWRLVNTPYMGDDQYVTLCDVEEFFDWKNKIYTRRQKLKEICTKLGIS